MARLEAVRDVCQNVADRTRAAVHQAQSNITELRRKGDPEVDELVCSTSIVHNQYGVVVILLFLFPSFFFPCCFSLSPSRRTLALPALSIFRVHSRGRKRSFLMPLLLVTDLSISLLRTTPSKTRYTIYTER
jgi:hypothetical protein